MPNLDLVPKTDLSSFRKIAIGTWRDTFDPQVYGTLELRMEEALRYIEAFRTRTGKHLTVTHLVGKAVALALAKCPDANAILRWNRIYLRRRIGIFFQVVMQDEGAAKIDLSGATLYDVEQKSLAALCDEFQAKVETIRQRKDPALEKTRHTFDFIPFLLLNVVTSVLSFLCYTLNLDLRRFGIPQDAFGSAMITNIGSLGLDSAFAPLVPYSRVPMVIALGAVEDVPVVVEGTVRPGKVMRMHATFDHRLIDGFHAAVMSKVIRDAIEHPFDTFDALF